MTDRTKDHLFRLMLVVVPALMSFAGSYAAVQASLAQKVDRVESAQETSRLDRRIDGVVNELHAYIDKDGDRWRLIQSDLSEIKHDQHVFACATRPRPLTCE